MSEEEEGGSATGSAQARRQASPFDGLSLAWKIATGGPKLALDIGRRSAAQIEKLALEHLKRRMAQVVPDPPRDDEMPYVTPSPRTNPDASHSGASQILARLIEASEDQTVDDARERLAQRIVRRLVPDEVRILAALADGHEAPLVHLGAGPLVGPATQRWIENMSPIGKDAGLRLIDEVPRYVTHLRDLGLLESGEEQKGMLTRYQLIEADTMVRRVCGEIERAGLRPRFYRRTLRLSDSGKMFWERYAPGAAPGEA